MNWLKIRLSVKSRVYNQKYTVLRVIRKLDMIKFYTGMKIYDMGKMIGRIPRDTYPVKVRLFLIHLEHNIRMLGLKIS